MKTIPILFSTPMVQAILEGRKTQTRRVIKKQPDLSKHTHITRAVILDGTNTEVFNYCSGGSINVESVKCPYGQPGDILWVRETWQHDIKADLDTVPPSWIPNGSYVYIADGTIISKKELGELGVWRPSIFMPKEACRLFLKVKSVGVEKLQDISHEDAVAEGIEYIDIEEPFTMGYKLYGKHRIPDLLGRKAVTGTSIESYQTLWESINGERSWNENPWVWVVEFEKVAKPDNF